MTRNDREATLTRRDELAGPPVRVSWGSILSGAAAALAVWLMLYALGLALGLSAVDSDDPGSLQSSGVFTGIWGVIAPLIALFIGGMVASRGAGAISRTGGAIQGLVMWSVTTLAGAWLLTSLLSGIVGGVASAGRTAAAGAGAAVNEAPRGNIAESSIPLDAEDALAPVNNRLRAEGKPPITAEQLQAAAQQSVQEAIRKGRFDRELLVENLAETTALSPSDAQEIAGRVETQFTAAKDRLAGSLEAGALRAADATGKAMWGVFAALFLGMLSAIAGAIIGVSRRQRRWADSAVPPDSTSSGLHPQT
jgi:hypothetical protein